jgi:hypothetical protein
LLGVFLSGPVPELVPLQEDPEEFWGSKAWFPGQFSP